MPVDDLELTPQEQGLYQMHLDNLYGQGGVDNPDGTRSSLLQKTVEIDGRVYNIPTVWGGAVLSPQESIKAAQRYGLDRFPNYASEEEAERRYDQMHNYMEQDTKDYLRARERSELINNLLRRGVISNTAATAGGLK